MIFAELDVEAREKAKDVSSDAALVPSTDATRDIVSRVPKNFDKFGIEETKAEFAHLAGKIECFTTAAASALVDAVPYLKQMQTLLSQRGQVRGRLLKEAGLPKWSTWAKAFAERLNCSMRTIQRRVKGARAPSVAEPRRVNQGERWKQIRLNVRLQAALVNSQVAANELATALKCGADWRTPLAEYEMVAIAPAKLDGILNRFPSEPDWREVLVGLIATLEQFGDKLPIPVFTKKNQIEKLMRGEIVANKNPPKSEERQRHFHVKVKGTSDIPLFAVVRDGDNHLHSSHDTQSDAEAVCDSLNNSPVHRLEQLHP